MTTEGYDPHKPVELNRYRVKNCRAMIHPELRALHRYWESIRAGRSTPLRSDIDPREMGCDARNLFILENLGRGNIRFRLAGTAIVDAFGMELRGMNARAIMTAASRESFTALIAETLEDPGTGYARLATAGPEPQAWEISLLPLRSDFGQIDRVIGCLHPIEGRPRRRGDAPLRFRIEEMTVEPILATVEDSAPLPVPGFAEPPRAFRPETEPTPGPGLTPIEGGLADGDARTPAPARDHLRLVKD